MQKLPRQPGRPHAEFITPSHVSRVHTTTLTDSQMDVFKQQLADIQRETPIMQKQLAAIRKS